MRLRGTGHFSNSRNIARIKEYETLAARHGIDLKSSQILEIGVGQRPYLGITLAALGYCYTGIAYSRIPYFNIAQKVKASLPSILVYRALQCIFWAVDRVGMSMIQVQVFGKRIV
jgi:hypothetical protein